MSLDLADPPHPYYHIHDLGPSFTPINRPAQPTVQQQIARSGLPA